MRTTFLKKLLNSTLAASILASGFVIPNPTVYAQELQSEVEESIVFKEGFDNYLTEMPTGWTEADTKVERPVYKGSAQSGENTPAVKIELTGQTLTSPTFKLETDGQLSFMAKGNGGDNGFTSQLVVEVLENNEWKVIFQEIINVEKETLTFDLTSAVTQVRFGMVKGLGNISIDDVAVFGTGSITDGDTTQPDTDAYGELIVTGASSLEEGMSSTLQVTNKEGDVVSDVVFESTNTDVLTVDQAGKMKALSEGITQIAATTTIDGKKYVGQKRIEVTKAKDYPITVFNEGFKTTPELPEGWETNLTADDKYNSGNIAAPSVKFTKQGQYIATEEFRLVGNGLLKFSAKGNSTQASGTTVLRVQYQSNFKDEWKNLAMFNSFAGNYENFGVRIPEDATRIRIFIEEKGQMNLAFDDMILLAQALGEKEEDTQAPTIEVTDVVESGNLDSDVTIKANITDNRKIGTVLLNYRVIGEQSFKTVAMGLTDGVYQGVISKKDLDAKGIEYYIEASDIEGNKATSNTMTMSISADDAMNPEITSISPAANANLGKNKTPKISAKYSDRSGINVESIKLFFNGEDMTDKATITDSELVYQVENELENGTYTVKLQLADNAGNKTEKEWTFKVADIARNLYFGQLHSHTNLSDGQGTIDEAYTYAKTQSGVDFLAVTDHSNSFDNDTQANIADGSMSTKWQTGLAAADKYNEDGVFTALYAYEMTWSAGTGKYGHMNTFNTEGFETRTNSAMNLKTYYNTLKTQSQSVSQFNHPGTTFGDFVDFGFYDEEVDEVITLIEVGNGDGPIRSSAHFPSYEYYTRALDKGWHVAPTNNQDNHKGLWGNANTARTVVEAEELTRDSLYEAIRERRVYSTEDENLEISYEVNGATMGSILSEQDMLDVYVKVNDPDAGDKIDKIQLITDGGRVAQEITNVNATTKEWTLSFEPDASSTYYYVKVTQGDLDIAVTAPVWIGEKENVGISSVEANSSKVLVGDEITVDTVVYNNESTPITNVKVEYYVNGAETPVATEVLATIPASDTATLSSTFPLTKKGKNIVEAVITLTVNGAERQYSERIEVKTFDSSEVSHVLIDGSKENGYVTGNYADNMKYVTELVGQEGGIVQINKETITSEVLAGIDVLIITDPSDKFYYSDEEVAAIKAFVEAGGDLIITSKADYKDAEGEFQNSEQGNKILEAIGATIRFNDDQVIDPVENGGQAYRLYFDDYNQTSQYTSGIDFGKIEQGNANNTDYKFSFYSGNSVVVPTDSKTVDAVVTGHETTQSDDADKKGDNTPVSGNEIVALAVETLPNGSKIVASGVTFFSDFEADPNRDYSNRTIMKNIINDLAPAKPAQITEIADLHVDADGDNEPDLKGETRTIEGIVTAGNSNPLTTFFDVIYVQDETGGITIHPISNTKIKLGQKVRITGVVGSYEGDTQLGEVEELLDVEIIDESINLAEATKLTTEQTMLEQYEGLLVTTQGVVKSIDVQAGNIIINDGSKDARVHINGYIGGGKSGEAVSAWAERIQVGDTLQVTGLAAEDAAGKRIRVRDTDEVVVIATPEQPGNGGTTTPEQPGNGGTTTPEQPGNGGTTTPEQPGNGDSTNDNNQKPQGPETGYSNLVVYLGVGTALVMAGYVAYTTNKRKNESN